MNLDKSETRIRQMFGEISPRYDLLNHLLSAGTDHYWRWKTVRVAPPDGSAPILDVCTGTGDLAIAYWKKTRGEVSVVGTDFTHNMLVLANEKQPKQSADRPRPTEITYLEADTQQLPFPDDSFQLVTVAFGLRNVTDTRRGVEEMVRVCRPQGRVAILEFSMPENFLLRRLYQFYFRFVLPRIGQLMARNRQSAYNYLPESVSLFPQGKELAGLLTECGLSEVKWYPLTFGIATLYCGRKADCGRKPE